MTVQDRVHILLNDLLDGALTDQQLSELRVLLRDHEAARTLYFRQVMTHAMLEWRHGNLGAGPVPTDGNDARLMPDSHVALDSTPAQAKLAGWAEPKAKPESPAPFGFLKGPGATGAGFYPVAFFVLLLVMVGAVEGVRLLMVGRPAATDKSSAVADGGNVAASGNAATTGVLPGTVAKMTAAVGCNWGNAKPKLKTGDGLSTGQTLELAAGVTEITYAVGARVIVQSPASFSIDSSKSIRLDHGKLTAEITSTSARGFKVITPDATFVDQGTEFGVEVAPGGGSRVHVFKGEVDLALSNKAGAALPTQRLVANSGARLEGDASHVTFVEETGESYLRSMDQTERDLHVIAYWRFEDHLVGTLLPDTNKNTSVTCATVDSSFNGNDLFTFSYLTRPVFSNEVASAIVPETGKPNQSCLDNTEYPGPAPTRDLYTYSSFSHASPIDMQRVTPAQWTVEASIKMVELGRVQTFVGRDGAEAHENVPPRLAFQITANGHLALRFNDADLRTHEAVSGDFTITPGRWYHVSAVSDGRQLLLYANALDGRGYQLVAHTDLPSDGSTALGSGGAEAEWTVGRGKAHNGWPGEWFKGWIDEVRISDIALDPAGFLFAPRSAAVATAPIEAIDGSMLRSAATGEELTHVATTIK